MANKKAALKAAFPHTIPVFTGFIVLGAAYGILMDSRGFSIFWTLFTSIFIYAGSMQFVSVTILAAGFHPLSGFLMTLMVNARHLFYGISMLEKYRGVGRMKPYLIFSLTDETFSLVCSAEPPAGVDRKWFMFFISALNQVYWVAGSLLGGFLSGIFQFNTKGIEFVLTALFVVIFLNQWKTTDNHLPALIGIAAAVICRFIFGEANFIIPSMILILLSLIILKSPLERRKSS
jgi:4-azaleucine resistance transporter AzlC